jgi:hypothetical protein
MRIVGPSLWTGQNLTVPREQATCQAIKHWFQAAKGTLQLISLKVLEDKVCITNINEINNSNNSQGGNRPWMG